MKYNVALDSASGEVEETALEEIVEETAVHENAQSVKPLDLEEVLGTLQHDISELFEKDPDWEVFAKDVKVIDQTGVRLDGLELLTFLQTLRQTICSRRPKVELDF